MATSLSSLVLVILLSIALRGRIGAGIYQGQHGFFMKIFAASLFMWFFIHIMKSIFFDYGFLVNDILVLTLLVMWGMVIYFVSLRIMRLEEVNWAFNFIYNKLSK